MARHGMVACHCWPNAVPSPLDKTLLGQHWLTNIAPPLTYQWYLMLDLCWSNAGIMMVSQHCANIGPLDKTLLGQHCLANIGQTLAYQWYLMLDLCWSNAGMMLVSQHCANIGLLDKTTLPQHRLASVRQMFQLTLAQRWSNVGVLSGLPAINPFSRVWSDHKILEILVHPVEPSRKCVPWWIRFLICSLS